MKNVFGWRETEFLGFETIKELWKQGMMFLRLRAILK